MSRDVMPLVSRASRRGGFVTSATSLPFIGATRRIFGQYVPALTSGPYVRPTGPVNEPVAPSPRTRAMTPAGPRPAHGPSRHSAIAPATCGAAWLVPKYVAVPPPGLSETTQVPGAAIACAASVAFAA